MSSLKSAGSGASSIALPIRFKLRNYERSFVFSEGCTREQQMRVPDIFQMLYYFVFRKPRKSAVRSKERDSTLAAHLFVQNLDQLAFHNLCGFVTTLSWPDERGSSRRDRSPYLVFFHPVSFN